MKCTILDDGVGDGSHVNLKLTELGMHLEDMGGSHLNGRNNFLIL